MTDTEILVVAAVVLLVVSRSPSLVNATPDNFGRTVAGDIAIIGSSVGAVANAWTRARGTPSTSTFTQQNGAETFQDFAVTTTDASSPDGTGI